MTLKQLLSAAAISLAAAACERSPAPDAGGERSNAPTPSAVIAQEVILEREAERMEAVGTARARASATIYPDTAGAVERVAFSAGDQVAAGDVLLQLEADEERLDVRLAEVAVREAEQLLARYHRIEDTGAISDSQIDEAVTALDAARIELDQARIALERRTVRAPFAGYVGLTDIDAGARISPSTVITQLDDRSTLFIDFDPPEQLFGRLETGDIMQARPFAGSQQSYQARIVNVDSRIDPVRRTFTVRAELANARDDLRPGMSFRVSADLLGEALPSAPEAAISWGSDGSYIWVIRDGATQREPVTLVERRQGRVLVRGNLVAGNLVVAEGVQKVREGTTVRILETRRPGRASGIDDARTTASPASAVTE